MTTVLDKANDASPTVDDVIYIINDPGGTPGDRRGTLGNVASAMAGWTPFTNAFAPLANPTGSGVATWPRVAASGVTGAALSTRLVGRNAAGAPASGAHLVGDIVPDSAGQLWLCTVSGSPGTWVAPGSGRELAYAEITGNAAVTGVGSAARADVAGLSVTFTPSARPLIIDMFLRYFLVGDGTLAQTTVAAGSNGVNTNTFAGAGTLNVASVAGYQTTGEIDVATGTTNARIRYTGLGATSFTGCYTLYGGGVLATGGNVNPAPVVNLGHGGLGLAITDSGGTVVADSLSGAGIAGPPTANSMKGPSKHFASGVLTAGVPVTYKIQAYCVTYGPHRIGAGAASPAFIIVREL